MSYFPLSGHRNLLVFPHASSPTETHHMPRSSSYMDKATFDSDIVVVVLALICAFICGIGLPLLISCALCWRRRMGLDSSDEVAIRVAMKALPIIVYADASKPPCVDNDCPICLSEFSEGEKVRVLPTCNHGFHLECIDKWFVSCYSCPVCRRCLNPRNGRPEGAAISEAAESNNAMYRVLEIMDSTEAFGVVLLGT